MNRPHGDPRELDEIADRLLDIATSSLPVRIEGEVVPEDHPDRRYTPLWIDEDAGYRYWASALYVRALMAFESTLLLGRAGLDPDARAHLRVMFEHLVAFAWIAADPADGMRLSRLGGYGARFRERMLTELAAIDGVSDQLLNELALTLEVNEKVKQAPDLRSMCRELDEVWSTRSLFLEPDTGNSFMGWYSRVYRGASGFAHVTDAGVEAVAKFDGSAFVIDRPRQSLVRILEIAIALTTALMLIATEAAPWLVRHERFSELEPLILKITWE